MSVSLNGSGMKAWAVVVVAGLCLGCAGGGQQRPVNTGLSHLEQGRDPAPPPAATPHPEPAEHELQRLAEESAVNLQTIFDQMNRDGDGEGSPTMGQEHRVPAPPQHELQQTPALRHAERSDRDAQPAEMSGASPVPGNTEPVPAGQPDVADAGTTEAPEAALPAHSLEEQIQRHTILLVDLLRQQAASTDDPLKPQLALASLEVLWPGALQKIITPESLDGGALTPAQISAIAAFRDFAAGMGALAQHSGREGEYLTELTDQVASSRPMRIRKAILCARVTGFGQYVPISSRRFMQGRNHPVIIYTEVASFAHRKATSAEVARAMGGASFDVSDLWAVELSQEVQVFHDADGLLVWSRPAERVLETSRNRRRDFFLVNEVVLPRTLSVGRYQMKVIMRDKTSGAVDEALISFEVVADPALAQGQPE